MASQASHQKTRSLQNPAVNDLRPGDYIIDRDAEHLRCLIVSVMDESIEMSDIAPEISGVRITFLGTTIIADGSGCQARVELMTEVLPCGERIGRGMEIISSDE